MILLSLALAWALLLGWLSTRNATRTRRGRTAELSGNTLRGTRDRESPSADGR